ncbi:MAG: 2-dehydro-3-deoxyphosphogluconate aldolase / (4S)-4-hydroxy-2-oxoglutarate aldolase [Chthoniobacter sp.]|jgi:2-dehydro-3-deoxyphosphogluconate aldolase/(4S)-4-hydroxy-2-oxoglutarate aldolase|nr:2-dehydro-3-deoxyphosphogluconate aldolase / (4S)-4-hydroxy-2-oxoglutarate aldolase [Chthoniobacter sp.]
MTKSEIIRRLLDPGILAIIRADSSAQLISVVEALLAGGVTAMEVTMTTPNALQLISEVRGRFGDEVLMGVGSVLDPETARIAILEGAEFVVTPVTKPEIIRMCNRYAKPIASGAFTPTEALTAHESGADFIKIFPADQGGPKYIKNILAPLPMLQIIPTGGVTPETVADFLEAGCVALGVGSSLVSKEILAGGDWRRLTSRAQEFIQAVKKVRG